MAEAQENAPKRGVTDTPDSNAQALAARLRPGGGSPQSIEDMIASSARSTEAPVAQKPKLKPVPVEDDFDDSEDEEEIRTPTGDDTEEDDIGDNTEEATEATEDAAE